jgi:hypothetical protein
LYYTRQNPSELYYQHQELLLQEARNNSPAPALEDAAR